jgi:hypothetical protein
MEIEEWLFEAAGPVIRLRLIKELGVHREQRDATERAVLALPEVTFWLDRLAASTRIHDSACDRLENIAGKLHELGLSGNAAVLDPHMLRWRVRLAELRADQSFFADYTRTMLIAAFSKLGYGGDDVISVARMRLASVYSFCKQGSYDIYLPENHFGDLPKQRAGKPLVKPELYENGQVLLPCIYDLFWLPLLAHSAQRAEVETLVQYILDECYQRDIQDGYGNIRAGRGKYYGMGWSVHLPGYDAMPPREKAPMLILACELMAQLPGGSQSRWFRSAVQYLDSFRTERATWRFPAGLLQENGARPGYYVNGCHMGLGEDRRSKDALEVESTYRMLRIRQLAAATARRTAP